MSGWSTLRLTRPRGLASSLPFPGKAGPTRVNQGSLRKRNLGPRKAWSSSTAVPHLAPLPSLLTWGHFFPFHPIHPSIRPQRGKSNESNETNGAGTCARPPSVPGSRIHLSLDGCGSNRPFGLGLLVFVFQGASIGLGLGGSSKDY